MYKIYLKQAWQLLKENTFLSLLTVVGTALAICMIMVIVIVYEVRTANYRPEVNRDRMLSVRWGSVRSIEKGEIVGNSLLSLRSIKECFYPLKSAEAVTGVIPGLKSLATVPGAPDGIKVDLMYTDAAFWKVFEFDYVAGKPFLEEEFRSGIRKAVVSEWIARQLYGTTDVAGKTVELASVPYTISGVVKDVPMQAEAAYANVWAPYTTTPISEGSYQDGILGEMRCYILAASPARFDEIRREVEQRVEVMNKSHVNLHFELRGQPDTQFAQLSRQWANADADPVGMIGKYAIVLLVLLLVPAFNLSGVTLSRMKKRMEELGVRKAFGATPDKLLGQILYENFFFTLIGGIVGLVFSYLAVLLMQDWLLSTSLEGLFSGIRVIPGEMLFKPMVFVYALLFCLLLNLVSAGIPAWRAARQNIVSSLNPQ